MKNAKNIYMLKLVYRQILKNKQGPTIRRRHPLPLSGCNRNRINDKIQSELCPLISSSHLIRSSHHLLLCVKQFIRMISLKSESEWIAQNSPLYMASEMASNGSFYALSKFWKVILALCAGQHKK